MKKMKIIKKLCLSLFIMPLVLLFSLQSTVYAAATPVTFTTDISTYNDEMFSEFLTNDSAGNVYFTNCTIAANNVKKFNLAGDLVLTFGSEGGDDGQFMCPSGIAVDSNGNIFVSERGNSGPGSRVQKFNAAGEFITSWGRPSGTGDGQFSGFGSIGGIAIDSENNVYVVDSYNDRVQKFDNNGNFLLTWGSNGSGDTNFYFYFSGDIAIDSTDTVFISDSGNHRIVKYTKNGVYLDQFGTLGVGDGQFTSPVGIDIDSAGRLYVADYDNNNVQKFENNGTFIEKWGTEGTNPGEFSNPVDVLSNTNNLVYVIDYYPRLQFFDLGDYVTPTPSATPTPTEVAPTVTTGTMTTITGKTATAAGNVTDDGNATITERGVVYSVSNATPTTSDTKVTTTGTTGAYTVSLTGLAPRTLYYIRAYATNSAGTSYGSVVEFTTDWPDSLKNVYFTFWKFKYGNYVSPSAYRTGDNISLKNYDPKKVSVLSISLYDYTLKRNQCYSRTWKNSTTIYMKTCNLLPTNRKYAAIFKFRDSETGIVKKMYFVTNTVRAGYVSY